MDETETDTDTMPTAEADVSESEAARIHRWRADELERAGYSPGDAHDLALRHDVDLHRAIELIQRGCPADLAARILL